MLLHKKPLTRGTLLNKVILKSLKLSTNCDFQTVKRKINQQTVFFTHMLKDLKYTISGSSVLSIIFMRQPKYDDFDLYFYKKSDIKKATLIFNNSKDYKLLYKTSYAITFVHLPNNKKIQLVYRNKPTAWHIANSHDFLNCAIAYTPNENELYVSPGVLQVWSDRLLVINTSPLFNKSYPDLLFFNQFAIFIQRIKKYKARYDLELCPKSKKYFKEIYSDYKTRLTKHALSLGLNAVPATYFICPYSGYEYAFKDTLRNFTLQEIL